jgi:S-adenosylmethionine synthetase
MHIAIESSTRPSIESLPIEVVERKGVGHPDTLCDAIAECASKYYSRFCLSNFGRIAHHWFDKVLLIGGEAVLDFGNAELTHPYTVIFCGKAAFRVGDSEIPVHELLTAAAHDVLSSTLREFVPEKHLRVDIRVSDFRGPGQRGSRYRPSSIDDLMSADSADRMSNDCCICSGFSPLSPLEQLVLDTERYVNGPQFKHENPDTGSDVKVIGNRLQNRYSLSVNLPFIAALLASRAQYLERVATLEDSLQAWAAERISSPIDVTINPEKTSGRSYLTVTGTVADTGDVGVVGRGNRTNGLITPMRPMSIEAAAGKNPLDHSGKIYAVIAQRLAAEVAGLSQTTAEVYIVTAKERPLSDPEQVLILVGPQCELIHHRGVINEAAERVLDTYRLLTLEFTDGVLLW